MQDFTRDISDDMLRELTKDNEHIGAFFPFVNFIKKHPNYDLALCFRGNDTKDGKVMIYKNNHLIWELYLAHGKPTVRISENHARFMENWQESPIKELMVEWGFTGPKDHPSYDSLCKDHAFIIKHKSKDSFTYDMVSLTFRPSDKHKLDDSFVEGTYTILNRMQESFFNEEFTAENPPTNYFMQYYFNDGKIYKARPQACLEKHVQQELFLNNHFFSNGLFMYDLEFAQPSIPGKRVPNDNKPDMFAIRFDKDGELAAICMVEVKSTESALISGSGLKKHLDGMKQYIYDSDLMEQRIDEARRILNRYNQLGLFGVNRIFSEDDFKILKNKEIIFIFSNGLGLGSKIENGQSVKELLVDCEGFKDYSDRIKTGKYSKYSVLALKKRYP